MAQLTPGFFFTGSLGPYSAYKRRGSDKIILRSKGGASKDKIKQLPSFEKTRKINAEFGGRSTASKWIREGLYAQTSLADYNIAGPLNALLKPIQALDTDSEVGQRHVLLSRNPGLLHGFSLNQQNPFDGIIRHPLSYTLTRESSHAQIDVPALLPGINFRLPWNYPLYGFVAMLAVVPDLFYTGTNYQVPPGYKAVSPATVISAWYPVAAGSPALRLDLHLPDMPEETSYSLMLSIGIRFGTIGNGDVVQQVPYAGSAKILALV